MKELHLKDFYRLLRESVRFYANINPYQRPNTFAVLESLKDLTSESLNGKTIYEKNKVHFYSRAWEEAQYNPSAMGWRWPCVFIFENDMNIENIFLDMTKREWNIEIYAMLPDWNECKSDNRPPNTNNYKNKSELYNDAESMLVGVLNYFKGVRIANTSLDGTDRLYNIDYLQFIKDSVSDFDFYVDESRHEFLTWLHRANLSTSLRKVNDTALNAYGVAMRLRIPSVLCEETYFSLSLEPKTAIYDHKPKQSNKFGGTQPIIELDLLLDHDNSPITNSDSTYINYK